ncbi:MAG TPA: type II secretion system minor pseudopilin GspK, partial [Gammaproteobacteria bacterium]
MRRLSRIDRMGGVALITAILVVALATTAAVAMVARQQFDVRRSTNLLAMEQGLLYQQGIEGWTMQILRRDRKDNHTDSPGDDWAMQLPPLPVEGGQLVGRIDDLQGLFNLNSLRVAGKVDALTLERFKRLMMVVGVEQFSADALLDWLDDDIEPTLPSGAEDGAYLGLPLPYRSANRLMASRSELRLLAGMSAQDYQRLAPYVTALPTVSSINVNTAPKELLRAIAEGISDSDAEALIAGRGERGYKSVDEFRKHEVLAGRDVKPAGLSVTSNYFNVTSRLRIGTIENGYSAMIYRNQNGGTAL